MRNRPIARTNGRENGRKSPTVGFKYFREQCVQIMTSESRVEIEANNEKKGVKLRLIVTEKKIHPESSPPVMGCRGHTPQGE